MRKSIISFLNNKFIEGGILLTVSNFLNGFLNYLFNSLSGKILGPAKYGEITALFSYLFITSVPMAVLLTDILRRLGQAGKEKYITVKMWEQWMLQKLHRWKFFFILYLFLTFPVAYVTNLSVLFSFTLLSILLLSFISVFYTSTLLGLQLFFGYTLVTLISTITKLLGPILIYFRLDGLTTIAFFLVASTAALIVGGKILLTRTLKKTKKVRPVSSKR
ncbi:hypothetical protein HYW87_01245, partial [Candidatus Roizmanbacteria bacterium]|nr:hypothetical protein [Candidatus Roizmanbacteria bacterium]